MQVNYTVNYENLDPSNASMTRNKSQREEDLGFRRGVQVTPNALVKFGDLLLLCHRIWVVC